MNVIVKLSSLLHISIVNKNDSGFAASHIVWQPPPVIFIGKVDLKLPVGHIFMEIVICNLVPDSGHYCDVAGFRESD